MMGKGLIIDVNMLKTQEVCLSHRSIIYTVVNVTVCSDISTTASLNTNKTNLEQVTSVSC